MMATRLDFANNENVDWTYILSHCDQKKYEIPYFYNYIDWKVGGTYRIQVSHIYDPSKFWVVLMEEELASFQSFLDELYKEKGHLYKMSEDDIQRDIYCVVNVDDAYYRGVIVEISYSGKINYNLLVLLIDFGYISVTDLNSVYYLSEKLYEVPRFAVRAVLSSVQPCNSYTWSCNVVERFHQLVSDKVLLGVLEFTNATYKTIYIHLADVDDGLSHINDIGDTLVNENLASILLIYSKDTKNYSKNKLIPRNKYPFLFPTFDAIEKGLVPSSVYVSDLLKQCKSSAILYKAYFSYNEEEYIH